ncbi:MAG: phosphoribosylformylglycinamidine synthase subunit PurQ [Deltaproteobacteria bacterium]|nr:phosphoribosylformylglycinamidine synthase subunit PurQ [Deltaproteobacteria bacterium]
MRAAVVVFPGSNSDAEMLRTLRDVCGVPTEVAWHRDAELPAGTDLVALPGGFSYGDYLRCGAIARTSPILAAVRRHAERGGFVLGVCNGFQILTEAGLLPGALLRNAHLRFECREVFLRVDAVGPFTDAPGAVLRMPIAHAEGRYHADAETLRALVAEGRVALRYVTSDGRAAAAANPNGAALDIAGIYGGPAKNVLGMMPHPERMSEPAHGGSDGRRLFDALLSSAARRVA